MTFVRSLLLLQILLESQRDFKEWQHVVQCSLRLLEDSEVRVREAISTCIKLLAAQHGAQVVQSMQPAICQSIEDNWVSPTLYFNNQHSSPPQAPSTITLVSICSRFTDSPAAAPDRLEPTLIQCISQTS